MKRSLAVALALLLALGLGVPALALEEAAYVVTNPYKKVEWSGENQWGAYKANLHTHTTFSDGDESLQAMAEEYYAQGYDVIANTDHGVVSKPWDQRPQSVPILGLYGVFKSQEILTAARAAQMLAGEGGNRGGRPMLQVPKGIELQAATVYKSHIVGLYGGWGQNYIGLSTDFRASIAGTDKSGGVTIIAHPGDWIKSEKNPDAARDPANVNFFADIFRDYDSCLGLEAYNGSDGPTRYDRVLWDELLMRLMPEGRPVWGFANDDSHNTGDIGRTAEILFMPANTVGNVRTCIETGAFLACSRRDRVLEIDGDRSVPFPGLTNIAVTDNNTKITITPDSNTTRIEWIADGKKLDQTGPTVDLADKGIKSYVRAQLIGPGGITTTQPFGVVKDADYRHEDDALQGWARISWTINLYLTKNVFGWLVENIAKLFN